MKTDNLWVAFQKQPPEVFYKKGVLKNFAALFFEPVFQ